MCHTGYAIGEVLKDIPTFEYSKRTEELEQKLLELIKKSPQGKL